MDIEILEKLGLSRAETKVYLALIELGVSTTGPLCKKSRIPSSNIYSLLNDLIVKGLISFKITANKKYFRAEDPHRLNELFSEKKHNLLIINSKLSSLIKDLCKRHAKLEKEQELFIYEGIKGIKTALEVVLRILEMGDTFYVVDASKISNEKLMAYFNDFHKRRIRKKIKYEIIYGVDSLKYAKERKLYSMTNVRVLPKDIKIPTVFWMFKGYVVMSVFADEPFALMIKNQKIYDSYMAYFRVMSKISRKI